MRMKALWLVLALLLAGCATTGGSVGGGGTSEQAVSQQTSTTDARTRSKIHTELGSLYLQSGRFGVAQEEAKIAIGADPTYAPAFNLMALVHMTLREDGAAEAQFRKALSLAPSDPEINNNFGWFLCQTDRVKQSVEHFMTAIRNPLYTTPAKAMTALGVCYLKVHDDAAAEDMFLKAVRVDGNVEATFWIADILYRRGRLFEARRVLGDLHKKMEPNPQSAWLALRVERKIGDREGEARYAAMMRRQFQNSPEYQDFMQGHYE